MIGISFDRTEDRQKLLNFIQAQKLVWPQYFDGLVWENAVAKEYAIHALPTTFLVGKDGRLAGVGATGKKLPEEIERLLK